MTTPTGPQAQEAAYEDRATMLAMAAAFRKAHDDHAAAKIAKVYAGGQREEANVIVGLRAALDVIGVTASKTPARVVSDDAGRALSANERRYLVLRDLNCYEGEYGPAPHDWGASVRDKNGNWLFGERLDAAIDAVAIEVARWKNVDTQQNPHAEPFNLEAALSTLQSGAEGKDGGYWKEMYRAANKRAEELAALVAEAIDIQKSTYGSGMALHLRMPEWAEKADTALQPGQGEGS